jgi:hypothetical protein
MKVFFKTNLFIYFYICKLNNLKVIDDLYSQCLTHTLSKTTSKSDTEGVHFDKSPTLPLSMLIFVRRKRYAPLIMWVQTIEAEINLIYCKFRRLHECELLAEKEFEKK